MAFTLQITDGTTTLNLANDTGFQLQDGWVPQFATPTGNGSLPPPVVDALPVYINATSDNNLAAHLQDLHALQRQAAMYADDPLAYTPVWLHRKLDAETGTVRTLVHSLEFAPDLRLQQWIEAGGSSRTGMLAVAHHPYWEATTARDLPRAIPATSIVYTYDYTAAGSVVGAHDIVGDVGARIDFFDLLIENALPGRVWMGVRSAKQGRTPANFISIWELEDTDATIEASGDTDRTTDATASPGGGGDTKLRITPNALSWTDWTEVIDMELADVSSNESDNFGTFLWLLRAQVGSGTWEIQLRWGRRYMDDADCATGEPIAITNTSWDIFEMDVFDIPLRDIHALNLTRLGDAYETATKIQVWARRTVGSGVLDLDFLKPLPLDEGWCVIKDIDILTGNNIYFGFAPEDDRPGALVYQDDLPPIAAHNFTLPPGDGRIEMVLAERTASTLTDFLSQINASDGGKYYERWLSLRGAE